VSSEEGRLKATAELCRAAFEGDRAAVMAELAKNIGEHGWGYWIGNCDIGIRLVVDSVIEGAMKASALALRTEAALEQFDRVEVHKHPGEFPWVVMPLGEREGVHAEGATICEAAFLAAMRSDAARDGCSFGDIRKVRVRGVRAQ